MAALLILFFHLWINLFPGNAVEDFIRQTTFVGVDMFFLIAAYSIGKYDVGYENPGNLKDYFKAVINRSSTVYIKYIIFALVAWIYKNLIWLIFKKPQFISYAGTGSFSLIRLIKVVCGVELFTKGGGAFLWFLPAIIIVYFLLPAYKKVDIKLTVRGMVDIKQSISKSQPIKQKFSQWGLFAITTILWFIAGVAVSQLTSYKELFIFWNRIPVILVGYYWGKSEKLIGCCFNGNKYADGLHKNNYNTEESCEKYNKYRIYPALIFTLVGVVLLYKFGYKPRLQFPIKDLFYVVGIPSTIGLTLLCGYIPEWKIIKKISSVTLEIYGVQMIFGYDICNWLVNITGIAKKMATGATTLELVPDKLVVNIISMTLTVIIAMLFNYLYKYCKNTMSKGLRKLGQEKI